jgi:hypothetical protein
MGKNRLHKGHGVADFVGAFELDLKRFGLRVQETKHILHRGAKGDERENPVAEFLRKVLPPRFNLRKGEAVDLLGAKSPQLDIVIFDRERNFPLYEGQTIVLAAEALLAAGEVKSCLNSAEVERSVRAAEKLKSLRPFKNRIAGPDEDVSDRSKRARYLHFVFAYETDLVAHGWPATELTRLERYQGARPWIDMIYVLGRGLINVRARKYIPESEVGANALVVLWYSLQNFLEREDGRRAATPYFSYANDLNKYWQPIS